MQDKDKQDLLKAGEIAKQVKQFAQTIVKKDMPMIELASKIEEKIQELGAMPAFPVNLSINDISAHHTPSYNDDEKTRGLLKIDFGVEINGFTADTAFSVDLESNEQNKNLIIASEKALDSAIQLIKQKGKKTTLGEIGKTIQEAIQAYDKFQPIINLSGHSISEYELHAGITIPNYNTEEDTEIGEGVFAIEPFVTLSSGSGKVYDKKPSGIYQLLSKKPVRDLHARQVLNFIENQYSTLPFCSRWLVQEFGTRALISLSNLDKTGSLHQFDELVEKSHTPIAQAEKTVLIEDKEVTVVN